MKGKYEPLLEAKNDWFYVSRLGALRIIAQIVTQEGVPKKFKSREIRKLWNQLIHNGDTLTVITGAKLSRSWAGDLILSGYAYDGSDTEAYDNIRFRMEVVS